MRQLSLALPYVDRVAQCVPGSKFVVRHGTSKAESCNIRHGASVLRLLMVGTGD